MSSRERGHFFMAYIRGEAREQTTMFPATLDELIPVDHMCRVMEAFVGRLNMAKLGFVRAEPAETGRPGYDPRDLLKRGASGAGETAERSGAGSTVYAHGQWTCSRLQRANGVDAEHALIVAHKITDTAGDNS